MPKHGWKQTKLFSLLNDRTDEDSNDFKLLLLNPNVMDSIEEILEKGGTTPKNFTLHDADHSFRVAERMWELIPDECRQLLSEYELGFLLLSAYLHDIGMSPEFDKVDRHREYLTSVEKNELSEHEINELQKWVDNEYSIKTIDVRKENVFDQDTINYIISYYVRHKHNDWSGEWILDNLKSIELKYYYDWTNDLISICKSHHYGLQELEKESFNPKPISNKIVHLRYIAMCLRVADVMENDPERTPNVILKHRHINEASLKYWIKDKQFTLVKNLNSYTVFARPDKAYLHKAIEETAMWIEQELRLCDELIKIKPLQYSSFKYLNYYSWNIESLVYKDIVPKDGTYEYIQGGFRPNTAKILDMLGGSQLYGDAIWAYRELIQNSFDAIKERIAYQIIHEERNPSEFLKKLGNIYSIELELQSRGDGYWLICKDQGVGMTKNIIEKFFLESGSSKRHEISELERLCKTKGFNFNRTGQFGIGVLSYFMIAEKIIVKTKREQNTGYSDNESKAWHFEISGTHDFGELRKSEKLNIGTEIELKLKAEINQSIAKWDKRFRSFLKNTITLLPCSLSYKSSLDCNSISLTYGWSNNDFDIKRNVKKLFKDSILAVETRNEGAILSQKERLKEKQNSDSARNILQEMEDIIEFLHDEGEIENLGFYRIYIPYFKLKKGNCFYYAKEEKDLENKKFFKIMDGYFWNPHFNEILFNLKGIRIKAVANEDSRRIDIHFPNARVEVNIENIPESSLSISRHTVIIDNGRLMQIQAFINEKVNQLLLKNVDKFNNDYGSLNAFILPSFQPSPFYWQKGSYLNDDSEDVFWEPVVYPLIEPDDISFKRMTYNGKVINPIFSLRGYFGSEWLEWNNNISESYTLTLIMSNGEFVFYNDILQVAPILIQPPLNISKDNQEKFNLIEAPKTWKNILLIKNQSFGDNKKNIYLNKNFKGMTEYNSHDYLMIERKGIHNSIEDLSSKAYCLLYLIYIVLDFQYERWIAICESKPEIVKHVFKLIGINQFIIYEREFGLIKLSFASWDVLTEDKIKKAKLLEVDNKNIITIGT